MMIQTYRGTNIVELTKDELLVALSECITMYHELERRHYGIPDPFELDKFEPFPNT